MKQFILLFLLVSASSAFAEERLVLSEKVEAEKLGHVVKSQVELRSKT